MVVSTPLQTLVESATKGDEPALEELITNSLPQLRAFIALHMGKVLSSKESSSDLVQSVCREVLQDLDQFEYRGEQAFKRWLFLTAQRKISSRARHWARQQRDVAREEAAPVEEVMMATASLLTPSRVAMGKEAHAMLWRALESLSEDQRRVLLLSRGLGMSHAEIAAEFERTPNAIRIILHRALARLAVMQDQIEDHSDG